jgi:dTDP-4-dehydrorhamnose reductase
VAAEWLLLGGDSEIGGATSRYLRSRGRAVDATTRRPERVASGRPFLDLETALERWEPPAGVSAACLFAAVSRLVSCAADPGRAAFINVTQTLALAERLAARGIYLLFLSTNQVFDGGVAMVAADAPTNPVSEYGRQKARAEDGLRALAAQGAPIGILRIAKVISPATPLLTQWCAELKAGRPIAAFHDMVMAPTPVDTVAAAIEALLERAEPGIFQLTGRRDVSYLEAADHLARRIGADGSLVRSVSAYSANMPVGATPRHTTLDSRRLRDEFGIAAPDPWPVIETGAASLSRGISGR